MNDCMKSVLCLRELNNNLCKTLNDLNEISLKINYKQINKFNNNFVNLCKIKTK